MAKKSGTKEKIFWTGLLIALSLISLYYFSGGLLLSVVNKTFLWNGLLVDASYTQSSSGDKGCSSWGGSVDPNTDTNSAITLNAYTNWGSCSGDTGNTNLIIRIPNPRKYEQIFIKYSGSVTAGGSISSNCASASAYGSVKQEGGEGATLFSKDVSCQGSEAVPANALLNIDGDFVSIPSSGTVFKLVNDNDLIFSFGISTGNTANGRSASGTIKLESIELTQKSQICTQVQTKACNPLTNEIKTFPTSCIDNGFTTDLSQCQQDKFYQSGVFILGSILGGIALLFYGNKQGWWQKITKKYS